MPDFKAQEIRVVFMGTPQIAADTLQAIIDANYNIIRVYTQPDKPAGRKKEIIDSPVKILSQKNNLPFFQPHKFDQETIDELKKIKPDIIIVIAYGKILPKEILTLPRFGCINIHASLLPKLRGASPIQNALILGLENTGITIILMDEGIDTGPIISQKSLDIDKKDTSESLTKKISIIGAKELINILPNWITGKKEIISQNEELSTQCELIEREDGRIFWDSSAEEIYNKYRGLYNWPGIFTYWERNDELLRIKLTKITFQKQNPQTEHKIGEVFELGDKIGIQTGLGLIFPENLQPEGKNQITINDFLNGYPNFIGSILK